MQIQPIIFCSWIIIWCLSGLWIASGATYYVAPGGNDGNDGTSWAQAEATIQAGVNDATNAGDEVIVSNGTYVLASQVSIAKAITVRGFSGNPADTIVDGNTATRCFNLSAAATVAAFTITNGNANPGGGVYMTAGIVTNCWFHNNRTTSGDPGVGGAYMNGGTIANCQFINNYSSTDGGGAIMFGSSIIRNCAFVTNYAVRWGGAIRMDGGSVFDCTFKSNWSGSGPGAVQMRINTPVVSNCLFLANHGAGTSGALVSAGNLYGCTFVSNRQVADDAGAICVNGSGVAENCIVAYNTTTVNDAGGLAQGGGIVRNFLIYGNASPRYGGGVRIDGGTLENCTLVGNYSGVSFGGIWNRFGVLRNLIVYSNSAPSSANYDNTMAPFTNSCTYPLPAVGDGNITNNPGFKIMGYNYGTNHVPGDCRLAMGSPCIDKGTNVAWMGAAFDLAGNSRINGTVVDIGAYELSGAGGTLFQME